MVGPGLRHENRFGEIMVVLLSLSLVLLCAPLLASALAGAGKSPPEGGATLAVPVLLVGVILQQCGLAITAWVGMRRLEILYGRPSDAPWKEVRLGFFLGIGLLLVNVIADQASVQLFRWWLGEAATFERMARELAPWQALFGASQPAWTRALGFVLVGFAAPVSEELFFRGFAHSVFRRNLGKGAAIVSAALFALIHFYVVHFVPIFLLGLILAWIYDWRKNLLTPIVAHGVMNALVAATLFISR